MASHKKVANAVSAKTARACDSCLRKRARWYCTADDAFLCQACDASVHSANPLALKHERVRLKTSSFKCDEEYNPHNSVPLWHQGFTRKARTPRHGKQKHKSEEHTQDSHSPVPELSHEDNSNDESEDQLVYRVPILDALFSQVCTSTNSNEHASNGFDEFPNTMQTEFSQRMRNLHGILPSEMELDQFAADVESLLGKGFDDESLDMESLGLLDFKGMEISLIKGENEMVKVETEEERRNIVVSENWVDTEIDLARETFELKFDYDSPLGEEEETRVEFGGGILGVKSEEEEKSSEGNCEKTKLLRLDYEGVITAWANIRSPWTSGDRPEVNANDCWPNCMGGCGISSHGYPLGEGRQGTVTCDEGREARVARYREKRRTRLFSKKIRYEVRKLNAEKRPRMKGRFVKRTTNTTAFAPPSNSAFPLLGK